MGTRIKSVYVKLDLRIYIVGTCCFQIIPASLRLCISISNSLGQNLSDGLVTEHDEKTSAPAVKTVERRKSAGLNDDVLRNTKQN